MCPGYQVSNTCDIGLCNKEFSRFANALGMVVVMVMMLFLLDVY